MTRTKLAGTFALGACILSAAAHLPADIRNAYEGISAAYDGSVVADTQREHKILAFGSKVSRTEDYGQFRALKTKYDDAITSYKQYKAATEAGNETAILATRKELNAKLIAL